MSSSVISGSFGIWSHEATRMLDSRHGILAPLKIAPSAPASSSSLTMGARSPRPGLRLSSAGALASTHAPFSFPFIASTCAVSAGRTTTGPRWRPLVPEENAGVPKNRYLSGVPIIFP